MFYGRALSLQCILSIALYFFFYRSRLALLQVRMEASTFRNIQGNPPKINSTLLKISECCMSFKNRSEVQLPIDILLLIVQDCEFLSCYYYINDPFKSYFKEYGYVHFGTLVLHAHRACFVNMVPFSPSKLTREVN